MNAQCLHRTQHVAGVKKVSLSPPNIHVNVFMSRQISHVPVGPIPVSSH